MATDVADGRGFERFVMPSSRLDVGAPLSMGFLLTPPRVSNLPGWLLSPPSLQASHCLSIICLLVLLPPAPCGPSATLIVNACAWRTVMLEKYVLIYMLSGSGYLPSQHPAVLWMTLAFSESQVTLREEERQAHRCLRLPSALSQKARHLLANTC